MQTYDVVIIGAGPVGLFQVFQLGLLGLNAAVVDSLPYAGGQCRELYADKPIYDIPGCVRLSGQQLIDNLLQQISPFDADFYLGEQVQGWHRQHNQFVVQTHKGTQLQAHALVIAAGVGMFRNVPLKLPGIARFEGDSLHYTVVDKECFRDRHLVLLGGGDTALREAIALQPLAASVTHVHKTSRFRAEPERIAEFQSLCEQHKIRSLVAQSSGFAEQNGKLRALTVTDNQGEQHELACDDVLALFGQSPDMTVMAEWPVQRDHQQIVVDTAGFASSEPGVYAVGDINSYAGKRKLILSGFHEATLAAFAIKQQLQPDRKVPLQYTTTSPLLHERLGVNLKK